MRVTIVSGQSGSGKTVALHTLEDEGFYCVDNLPSSLLPALLTRLRGSLGSIYQRVAVGIDARGESVGLADFPELIEGLRAQGYDMEVVYLRTEMQTLLRRFSETRRKHPLSRKDMPLVRAIEVERNLLATISGAADVVIDTTQLNLHQLREQIRARVVRTGKEQMSLLVQSFGFKYGLPSDTDFVFDVRCLPNPHWEPELREQTGRDQPVAAFLDAHPMVEEMYVSMRDFLDRWIPAYQDSGRAYMTVSIGCTGGQHRSVYLTERLHQHYSATQANLSIRHRELE
jgi:UPF0042 nucleotide-binding protein